MDESTVLHDKALYQVSLKIFLKNREGKTLILESPDESFFAGSYDFPGGRIDENEHGVSLENILKREILEELGDIKYQLKYKPVAVGRHQVPSKQSPGTIVSILMLFFEAEYLEGEIKLSEEHTKFAWEDLESMDLEKSFKGGTLEAVKMYLGK